MPTLRSLLVSLKELGVSSSEIQLPRKVFAMLLQQAKELAEEDSEDLEED